jgi:hypothetical protein
VAKPGRLKNHYRRGNRIREELCKY